MAMVLIDGEANTVVAHRVRLRDRLRARLRAFELDQELAAGTPADASPALALRARKLIDERTRDQLGQALRRVASSDQACPSVVHLTACPQTAVDAGKLLGRLSTRLLAPAPVEARGVAQARILLSDGCGPLFWNRRSGEIRARVQQAIEALEPSGALG